MAIYETERLYVRPSNLSDAEFFFELFNTEKWLQNIGDRNVRSVEDARAYISNRIIPQFERLGFANYTLLKKDNDQRIGVCGLYDRPFLEGIDIGFALLPQFEGLGYGFEAANKVKDMAFNEFGLKKIVAITLPENIASQKLLEKIEMRFQKIIRLEGDTVDLKLFECDCSTEQNV